MIQVIIFDLDDTLYDELDYCRSGYQAVASHLNLMFPQIETGKLAQAFEDAFLSGQRNQVFNTALETFGIDYDREFILDLVKVYRGHFPAISLDKECLEVLETVRDRYRLGLLTDGFLPAQRYKVEALGIESFFEKIVYTEQLGREFWKPNPRGFEHLLDFFQCPPDQSVYIGDNLSKDFVAPNALGMHTIQVRRPNGVHLDANTAPNGRPQQVCEGLSPVLELVGRLESR